MCRNTIKADFILPTLRPLVVGWVEVLLFLYNPVGRARQTIFIIIIIINETRLKPIFSAKQTGREGEGGASGGPGSQYT